MNKTKIDWATMSWNPVTGCLNDCEYCYARRIANRFGGFEIRSGGESFTENQRNNFVGGTSSIWLNTHGEKLHVFNKQPRKRTKNGKWQKASHPYGFEPTFHQYRLDEPQKMKKSQNIFVCSMADLFGDWIPDEWIEAVFEACAKAPQHRYLFLTKNMHGYEDSNVPAKDNHWYGQTWDGKTTWLTDNNCHDISINQFISIEPLQNNNIPHAFISTGHFGWIIIGAETGNRKDKVIPKREWIENIVNVCRENNVPVFMKESLADIWGEPLIQEYPWEEVVHD